MAAHRPAAAQAACAEEFSDDADFVAPAVVAVADRVLVSAWVDGARWRRLPAGSGGQHRTAKSWRWDVADARDLPAAHEVPGP